MLADMGKHSELDDGSRRRWRFGRRKQRDTLFERSFQACTGCGEDVYVLAQDCRECGRELELVAV
jgi:predicted amidophosphoribosyltransferase